MFKLKAWLLGVDFRFKLLNFLKWKFIDIYRAFKYGKLFDRYGCTFFVGRQGSGKTTSMVDYLEDVRVKFPLCQIVTNFGYVNETQPFADWYDFFNIRNGKNGVIFAIDEIQNEFSTLNSKNFPEFLLSEITQQRKQRVKIICTSQVFKRVAKPLREQAFEVVECRTVAKRWVFLRCFDGDEYNGFIDSTSDINKSKVHRLWRKSYIMDDHIRSLFDTDKKIERLAGKSFLSAAERVY